MNSSGQISRNDLATDELADVCRRYHVSELSLFGSAIRGELRPDSDLDFLVEFDPDAQVSLLTYAGLMEELAGLFNRPVDVVPKQGLKKMIRKQVLSEAEVIYAA